MSVVVRVRFGNRRQLKQAYTRDLDKSRLFLRTDAPLPIGSAVPMVLELHDGQAIDVQGEVSQVRLPQLATPEQPAGMHVRLVDFTAEKRARVEDLLRRSRTVAPGMPAQRAAPLEQMLASLRRVVYLCADAAALSEADYYQILGLPRTATAVEVREACSVVRTLLDPATPPGAMQLTPEREAKLRRVYQLVIEIEKTMTDPAQRAEYDAVRFGSNR